jgi:hypothetical protein
VIDPRMPHAAYSFLKYLKQSYAERMPTMLEKMVAPELFRPPVDFPDVPYDHLVRAAAERTPDHPAIIYHDLIRPTAKWFR